MYKWSALVSHGATCACCVLTVPLSPYSDPPLRLPSQIQSPHDSPQEVTAFSAYRNTNYLCHTRVSVESRYNTSTGWEAVVIVLACPASQNQCWGYICTAGLPHSMPLWSHTSLLLPPLTTYLLPPITKRLPLHSLLVSAQLGRNRWLNAIQNWTNRCYAYSGLFSSHRSLQWPCTHHLDHLPRIDRQANSFLQCTKLFGERCRRTELSKVKRHADD